MSTEPQDSPEVEEQPTAEVPVDESIKDNIDESNEQEVIIDPQLFEQLSEENAALKDQMLRVQAEAQNARRRAEQDVEKARKYALEKFVGDLLPVADNLERAIAAGDPEDEAQKAMLEGVELTLKSLLDTLKKFQVETVDPQGEPFDPQLHQAMSMVPSPDVEPNTVINVFQKGYTLNGRLVRPAMVVVSSSPPIDQQA